MRTSYVARRRLASGVSETPKAFLAHASESVWAVGLLAAMGSQPISFHPRGGTPPPRSFGPSASRSRRVLARPDPSPGAEVTPTLESWGVAPGPALPVEICTEGAPTYAPVTAVELVALEGAGGQPRPDGRRCPASLFRYLRDRHVPSGSQGVVGLVVQHGSQVASGERHR